MSPDAWRSNASHAQACAQAKKRGLPKPLPPSTPRSTALDHARAEIEALKAQIKCTQRSAHGMLKTRKDNLSNTHAQLQDTTQQYTSVLQDQLTMQTNSAGLAARIDALSSSLKQNKLWLAATVTELSQTQHELKMAHSDLAQTGAREAKKSAHIAELTREIRRLRAQAGCVRSKCATTSVQPLHIFKIKERGKVPLAVRVTVLRLVALGIGIKHVFPVVQCLAGLFEVALKGSLSPASIQNIIHEGGVAAHLQVAEAMRDAKSACNLCLTHSTMLTAEASLRRDHQQRQHID
jgi:hypothetical protein